MQVDDPEGYAQYILAHSQRSHEQHLWSGVNYRQLAQFFRPRNPLSRSNSHTELFSFAVTHALSVDGGRSIEEFDGEHGHTELSTWLGRQGSSLSLIFLRGYPSANWLKTVGAHCRVDPEFFRRHLDFNSPQEFYDLPALPSTARNIIKLRVTTVFRRTSLLDDKTIDKLRAEEEDHVREHQKQLNRVGESIVRKFSIHDKSYFSIEQNISICVCRRVDKGWQAIIWTDTGKDLSKSPHGPWLKDKQSVSQSQSLYATCVPILYHHTMAPERLDSQAGLSSSSEKPSNSFHSSSLLSTQYGLSLDPKVAAVDALYSISEVFLFIAGTEHQFLNMMAILLKKQLNPTLDYMEATIKNLNHIKASIDSHHEYLEEALRCLEHGGDDNWPKASLSAHKDIAERTRNALVGDFSHLLQRAVKLSKSCTTGCNAITNSTMLQEARAGLQQGAQMKRLTILAFLYLPLNLTTSFFGMNFREFGQGTLSLAWILAVLVPVVLITVGLFSWTAISKLFRGRKGKKDKGVEDAASQTPTLPKTATV